MTDSKPTYDVVVVGAGPAGLTAAEVLVRSGRSVCVIEAGGANNTSAFRSANFFATRSEAAAWWPNVLVRHTSAQDWTPYRQGRGLGGGGAVNGLVCLSDPTETTAAQSRTSAELMRLTRTTEPGALGGALLNGWGAPAVDLAVPNTTGIGLAPLWLDAAGQRRVFHTNSELLHATVNEIVNGRPALVRTSRGDIRAHTVVLCGGAIQTAHLVTPLVGPGRVGHQIQDHPGIRLSVRLRSQARITEPTHSVGSVIARWSSADEDSPDLQLLALDAVGTTAAEQEYGVLMIALMSPRSRGTLSFDTSSNQIHNPRLDLNMLSDPRDRSRLRVGLRRVIALINSGALDDVAEDVFIDARGTRMSDAGFLLTDDQLTDKWMMQTTGDYSHVVGSCPPGPTGVTDTGETLGRITNTTTNGPTNVWIADASLFAQIPAANTMIPTMAIATEVATRIVESTSIVEATDSR